MEIQLSKCSHNLRIMMYRHFITLFSISSGALYNNALNHSKKCKYTISFSASHNLSFIVRRPFRCKARDAAFFIRRIPARPYSIRSDGRVCPAQNRQKEIHPPTGQQAAQLLDLLKAANSESCDRQFGTVSSPQNSNIF